MNSPGRRHVRDTALAQCPMNLGGAVVAQITHGAQFVSHGDDEAFQVLGCAPRGLGRVRPVVPGDAIEPLGTGTVHPALHGAETHVMGPRDAAHQRASSHCSHHRLALLRRRGFWPC